jgi:hypothetical protein
MMKAIVFVLRIAIAASRQNTHRQAPIDRQATQDAVFAASRPPRRRHHHHLASTRCAPWNPRRLQIANDPALMLLMDSTLKVLLSSPLAPLGLLNRASLFFLRVFLP